VHCCEGNGAGRGRPSGARRKKREENEVWDPGLGTCAGSPRRLLGRAKARPLHGGARTTWWGYMLRWWVADHRRVRLA
jgi:hypothetical protein